MPALKGRRLTVYDIVTQIFYEKNLQVALDVYEIGSSDALDAVTYCMGLKCQSDPGLIRYCDGCVLRTIEEGWTFKRSDYIIHKTDEGSFTVAGDGSIVQLSNLTELEKNEFGKVTWLMAEHIHRRFF